LQAIEAESRSLKKMAGDDDVGGTRLEPFRRVAGTDATADLQTARIRLQRGPRRRVIPGPELDDMTTRQAIGPVKQSELGGGSVRFEIGSQTGSVIPQTATDNLFHLPLVEVDAGAEPGNARDGLRTET
jgi:hypothetical protein